MEHIKELLGLVLPFISGGLGCYIGVKVSLAVLRTEVDEIKKDIDAHTRKLNCQVGETRCVRMRTECRSSVFTAVNQNRADIAEMRTWCMNKFEDIAKFMGRINGENHST